MPVSTKAGKRFSRDFIKSNFPKESTILDVGPGIGTYAKLLGGYFENIDAIEIFERYLSDYD